MWKGGPRANAAPPPKKKKRRPDGFSVGATPASSLRVGELVALVLLAMPGLVLGFPVVWLAVHISERKANEAVAGPPVMRTVPANARRGHCSTPGLTRPRYPFFFYRRTCRGPSVDGQGGRPRRRRVVEGDRGTGALADTVARVFGGHCGGAVHVAQHGVAGEMLSGRSFAVRVRAVANDAADVPGALDAHAGVLTYLGDGPVSRL